MIPRCAIPLLLVAAFSATARAEDKPSPEGVEFFEKKVRPVLVKHCYSCHSAEAKKLKGELRLDTRDGVLRGGASGPAVAPGEPAKSLLVKSVKHAAGVEAMPPKGKLADQEIADLEAWVKMGAPDPRAGGKNTGRTGVEKAKEFWSFRPVSRPAIPKAKSQIANPVDAFILAKLEAKGLKPSPPADKRTLIRRATFDLTGLPPTPEEIDAFLKDQSPEAFAKVVDRLLASPAYGERWGRHWMDVVRYADTAGDNSDYPVPQMYRYRNWIIDAFNRDLPYDEFIRQQIAGDLLPFKDEADRRAKIIATGYLANTKRFGSYEDERYPWYLTYEDQIDNLGRTFLGLTINCCRCHDHKFDPLSQHDYYALYGFFSSTRYPRPGIELDKVQRDFVPLASPEQITAYEKQRDEKLRELKERVKKLEAEKAPAAQLKAVKKERDEFAKQKPPLETSYAGRKGRPPARRRWATRACRSRATRSGSARKCRGASPRCSAARRSRRARRAAAGSTSRTGSPTRRTRSRRG
jgi:hypothetical protein